MFLGYLYRRFSTILLASAPALLGASLSLGILALFGAQLSFFHLIGALVVLGMGVDYGIFLVEQGKSVVLDEAGNAALVSILAGAFSSALAFGALALSSFPPLAAVGATTALGVAVAFCVALMMDAVLCRTTGVAEK